MNDKSSRAKETHIPLPAARHNELVTSVELIRAITRAN